MVVKFLGLHSPKAAAAKRARFQLQSLYDRYLKMICGVQPSTPSAMLLAELGLSPLKVHWLLRSLNFWNELVSRPIGTFHRTLLFDNWVDATQFGVRNFSYSVYTTLQDLGCPLSVNPGVLPELDVQQAVTALQQSLLCAPLFSNPRTAPSVGIVPCTYHNWFVPLEGPSPFHWEPMSGLRWNCFLGFRLGSLLLLLLTSSLLL